MAAGEMVTCNDGTVARANRHINATSNTGVITVSSYRARGAFVALTPPQAKKTQHSKNTTKTTTKAAGITKRRRG